MGLIRNVLSFAVGAVAGVYAAQNYNVPNVHSLITSSFSTAQHMEEQYRKPGGSSSSSSSTGAGGPNQSDRPEK